MLELALEAKARKEGEADGIIRAALQLQAAKDTILQMLTTHFEGDEQEAATTFTEYMTENPKEGAYLQI